ncbi:MAG: homocysteine S-methyltransferase family protein [Deltaproteobacteria bacterium]|nr:homocysteine S-methyltransferase family protein [Deltaproteobacteria bacterium]
MLHRVESRDQHPLLSRVARGGAAVLGGGLSQLLAREGYQPSSAARDATAARDAPDLLARCYQSLIEAGVDVLPAHTGATHPRSLARAGVAMRSAAITHRAVDLAREEIARSAQRPAVAGLLGPLGIEREMVSMRAARQEFVDHVARLAATPLDLIVIEPMPTLEETLAATSVAALHAECWAVLSLSDAHGAISGLSVVQALRALAAVGANTVIFQSPVSAQLIDALEQSQATNAGVFFGARLDLSADSTPMQLAQSMGSCMMRGARVLSASGQVTAAHFKALTAVVRSRPLTSRDAAP